jgi:hypothetical protein
MLKENDESIYSPPFNEIPLAYHTVLLVSMGIYKQYVHFVNVTNCQVK